MRVRGGTHAWGNEGVGALDGELRTCEAQHVLRGSGLRKERAGGKGIPMHDERSVRVLLERSAGQTFTVRDGPRATCTSSNNATVHLDQQHAY